MFVVERNRSEYFRFGDVGTGWSVVDTGTDVSESVVVVGFVLEVEKPF